MRSNRTRITLLSLAALLLAAPVALAEDEAPPFPGREFCQENPGKCEEARAKHAAWCEQYPDRCAKAKEKRAERREWCEKNPEKCAQKKAEREQRRAELKAKCEADPAKCEEMKQQMREHRHHKMGDGSGKPAE
jgi:flagellar motility protein MotE (MotC chaperone)